MEFWMIIAAVVLAGQAAKVPQQVIQQVTVPVPSEVLAAPPAPTTTSQAQAQVVQVAKDHVLKKDEMEKVMTTMQPEIKTMMPTVTEIGRTTRAVPYTDNERTMQRTAKHQDMNMMKDNWNQRTYKMSSHRSMRSVKVGTTTKPVAAVTEYPVNVKSSSPSGTSTIDPCDLLCTKFEFEPICASNSLCLHEFPNQCILDTYNCKHPKGKFAATKDDSCQMNWLTKCDESEMI